MKYLAFDDIVRNLLVYLKGQVPSLNAKNDREEVLKQIHSMTFTLRSTIVQLEGAAFQDPRNSEDFQNIEKELQSLKVTNSKLEESLFLEMNKTQELKEKNASLSSDSEHAKVIKASLEQKLKEFQEEIKLLKNRPAQQTPVHIIDNTAIDELKSEMAQLEVSLGKAAETNKQLRQALQNKDVELTRSKEALVGAMSLDKTEIAALKNQLANNEQAKTENATLKSKIAELERDLALLPPIEIFRNNFAAAEAKTRFLETSLAAAQSELKSMRSNIAAAVPEALVHEKKLLEQRVLDLEATLRSVIKSRDNSSKSTENFSFSPEECVFLFETLSTTTNRLAHNLENRDVYVRSQEAIAILEKSNAIQKVYTVGQLFDSKIHKAAKSFKSDFLPDGIVMHEESPGFVSGNRLVQKAVVWVAKSLFSCTECGNVCRPHEFFCPKCGLELTAPDGTSKRDLPPYPTAIGLNLALVDELIKQGSIKAANALVSLIARDNPANAELGKRQAMLQKA